MESHLDDLEADTVTHLTAPQRRALGIRMAATAWRELGPSSSAAKVGAYIAPHCARLGMSASKRTTERWAGIARTEQIQGLDPTDIERTRALLGTDARASAMKLFALSDAYLPSPAKVRAAVDGSDAALMAKLNTQTRMGIRASDAALAANTHVLRLYSLDKIPPIGEVLTAPEQRSQMIEIFVALVPRMAAADLERFRQVLNSQSRTASEERPALALLHGGEGK